MGQRKRQSLTANQEETVNGIAGVCHWLRPANQQTINGLTTMVDNELPIIGSQCSMTGRRDDVWPTMVRGEENGQTRGRLFSISKHTAEFRTENTTLKSQPTGHQFDVDVKV